jgi:hypothetical protein
MPEPAIVEIEVNFGGEKQTFSEDYYNFTDFSAPVGGGVEHAISRRVRALVNDLHFAKDKARRARGTCRSGGTR